MNDIAGATALQDEPLAGLGPLVLEGAWGRDAREYLSKGPIDSYRRYGFGLYLTSLRGAEPIGICGLVRRDSLPDVDVGFAFLEQYWSKGYAAESAAAVLAWGREHLRLPRIIAITAPDNAGSIAVLEKIGLRFDFLTFCQATFFEPNRPLLDTHIWVLPKWGPRTRHRGSVVALTARLSREDGQHIAPS